MNLVPELLGHYNAIDRHLDLDRQSVAHDSGREKKIEQRQKINDQAYFVLCWGQLETELDDRCRNAIRRRRDNPDWTRRRGWDLYNPEDRKLSGLSFEDRVSLVLDRQAGRGSAWSKVMKWYGLRNLIVHGGSYEQRIDLNFVIGEFYEIQSEIAP
ncbi:MAG: hypothetical protein ACT4SY_06100 [Hyphomicrobiales bacterium]